MLSAVAGITDVKTPLERILVWSQARPLWQRDALRRILTQSSVTEEDITELAELCLKGVGDSTVKLEAQPLEANHIPKDPGPGESIRLKSISDVVGVNQLAADQVLKFEANGITVIYGPNGTGKSGYTRILKRACKSRHAGRIMPDVSKPSTGEPAKTKFELFRSSGVVETIDWFDDNGDYGNLSALTIFDRDSGAVHVREENEIWFRPFGLDVPDELVKVFQKVKRVLDDKRMEASSLHYREINSIDVKWIPVSDIGKFFENLSASSDIEFLNKFEPLTDDDKLRLSRLKMDLSHEAKSISFKYDARANELKQMLRRLTSLKSQFGDASLTMVLDKFEEQNRARLVADAAAKKVFSDLKLDGVGSLIWKALWVSARRYSESLEEVKQSFPPQTHEHCVLCHQEISHETHQRMGRFEKHIKDDTERRAITAQQDFERSISTYEEMAIRTDIIRSRKIIRDKSIQRQVVRFLASIRLRKRQLLQMVRDGKQIDFNEIADFDQDTIKQEIASLESYSSTFRDNSDEAGRILLETELANLEDRKNIVKLKSLASKEIARLKAESLVERASGETRTKAVTDLGTKIADEFITSPMRDRFQQEIVGLAGDRVRVEVTRKGGRYGSPRYQVKLFANPNVNIHMVLSEGEQTCVALAAYLTELSNATHNSTLVFDDPVTSLDHRWRRKVAKRLVKEASQRQVVIFTHDLVFLNEISSFSKSTNKPCAFATLSRGIGGVGIYTQGLPWRAASIRDRIDKLEKKLRANKKNYEKGADEDYRSGTSLIYSELRATWERALEDTVFAGVINRHRDYINTKDLNLVTVLSDQDVSEFNIAFKKCCDFTESHDPARGRDGDVPDPSEVMNDIQSLKAWESNLRQRQNELRP